jgi:hypothetical protein
MPKRPNGGESDGGGGGVAAGGMNRRSALSRSRRLKQPKVTSRLSMNRWSRRKRPKAL